MDNYEEDDGYYDDPSGESPGSYTPKGSVFHRILDSAKNSIRPEEIPHNEDEDGGDDRNAAARRLRNGERSAASNQDEGGKKNLYEAEKKDSGFINNVGKMSKAGAMANIMDDGSDHNDKKKKKRKGRFKPGAIIASTLVMGAFVGIFGGQTNSLFQLVENMKLMRDEITVSRRMRSRVFYRYQADISEGRIHKSCKSKAFNGDTFRLNPEGRMAKKLSRVGIDVDSDGKTMHWTSSTGQKYTIITDKNFKAQTKGMNAEQKAKFLADFEAQNGSKLAGYEDLYSNNPEFRDSAYTALRTLKGAFHEMYGKVGEAVFKRLGNIKRFVFDQFKPDAEDADVDFENRVKPNDDMEVKTQSSELKDTGSGDEDDKIHLTGDGGDEDVYLKIETSDVETTKVQPGDGQKVVKGISDKAQKASSILMGVANGYCVYTEVITSVNLVVHGIQVANAVQQAMNFQSGIEMARTEEYAANSPIHLIGQMVEKQATFVGTFASKVNHAAYNGAAGLTSSVVGTEKKEIKGRFSDSPSIASYVSGEPVNPTVESVKTFMMQSGIKDFMEALRYTAENARFCAHARRAAAYIGAATDVVGGIVCIVSIFVAAGAGCVAEFAKSFAIGAGIGAGLVVLIAILTPYVENALMLGKQSGFAGILGGEEVSLGTDTAFEGINKTEGPAVQSKESLTASLLMKEQVIAEEAEYVRRNTSPFDASTQFTFMGSLLKSVSTIRMGNNSILGILNGAGGVVSSSVKNLLPTASAMDVSEKASKIISYSEEGCPNMDSIGGVGNQFCSPYMGTDRSTIEADPADIVNEVDSLGQFEDTTSGDQPVIKKDSKLAKYIVYCGQRTSPYGIADVNIANEIGDYGSTGNSYGDAAIGAIPIAGDVIDIVQNQDKLDNFAFITGEACVQGNENDSPDAPTWEESKYYQRFIEDQYLAESEGITKEGSNPVEKFLAEYYEEHPLDNSYEGIIARYAGRTKDTVIAVLDIMDYSSWVAQYDPTDLYPTPNTEEDEYKFQYEGEQPVIASIDAIFRAGFFEERRQRNFAV